MLLNLRDPVNDKRPIALALKLQDAQIVGYWGEASGDEAFCMNRGYAYGQIYDSSYSIGDSTVVPCRYAILGSQIPTSETPESSNMACFLLLGPGVRVGYERD